MSDIKKRMNYVRAALFPVFTTGLAKRRLLIRHYKRLGLPQDSIEHLTRDLPGGFAVPSPDALKRAKNYFGTDDDSQVMLAMAEVLFGEYQRGKPKGQKTWTTDQYLELFYACAEVLEGSPKKLSDAKLAKILIDRGPYKAYDADTLRRRIAEARGAWLEYQKDLYVDAVVKGEDGEWDWDHWRPAEAHGRRQPKLPK
jgi:hypothetical protein